MERYLVFKSTKESSPSHGTAIHIPELDIWITSHPLDDELGAMYLIAPEGQPAGALPVVAKGELAVPAAGLAVESIAPYVYQLTLGKPIAGG